MADEGPVVVLKEGRTVRRLEAPHRRVYQSVFGSFVLERVVYGTREDQKIESVPLDARLQLPEDKWSYWHCQLSGFEVARGLRKQTCDRSSKPLGAGHLLPGFEGLVANDAISIGVHAMTTRAE